MRCQFSNFLGDISGGGDIPRRLLREFETVAGYCWCHVFICLFTVYRKTFMKRRPTVKSRDSAWFWGLAVKFCSTLDKIPDRCAIKRKKIVFFCRNIALSAKSEVRHLFFVVF